jgi:hypothetical protein
MGFREDLFKRIEKKRAEIAALEGDLRTGKAYLQALEDTYKLVSKGAGTGSTEQSAPTFRAGSMLGAAYEAIKKAGRPLHVNELLPAIGRSVSRADRSALSGTLAAYVRKGEVFTRPAPNTFGLVDFAAPDGDSTSPPPGFGQM